jgi:hypothetical protein
VSRARSGVRHAVRVCFAISLSELEEHLRSASVKVAHLRQKFILPAVTRMTDLYCILAPRNLCCAFTCIIPDCYNALRRDQSD